MDWRVTPPKWVTSPTWGPPPPCKQALSLTSARRNHTRLAKTQQIHVHGLITI